jgi:multidrug efflux pump subunit AcrA (membrane-fusion protein)
VIISAEVAGRIVKIHPNFQVGSFFSKGDVLVELDEEDVTQQEISYENALANKILAASQVEVAKTSIKEYLEGTYQTELASKEMALVVAQTNSKSAKDMQAHAQKMFRKGYISNLELGSKADAVRHAELEVKARQTELNVFQNITKAKVLQELEANLSAAQARLAAEEAALKLEKQRLGREQLRAPFDGRVIVKSVGLGQQVSPDTVLGEVISVDYAEVRLPLARRDLQFLELPELSGDELVDVELRDAIDENSEIAWAAKIVRTEGMLDPDSLEVFAIAVIDDPFGLHSQHPVLRMGQPVTAAIRGKVLDDVIKVPRAAVSQLNQVFLVDKEQLTLSQRTIQPLWSDDEYMIIRDPTIQHGDLLATTNLVYAPEGSPVEIIPAAVPDDVLASTETKEMSQR